MFSYRFVSATKGRVPFLRRAGLVTLVALGLLACEAEKTAVSEATGEQNWEQQLAENRRARVERLRAEDGWLSLVGLHWLENGANTLGSAKENRIVLPAAAPPRAGTIVLEKGAIVLRAEEGSGLMHASRPVTEIPLKPDTSGDPTVIEIGSVRFNVIERGGRFAVRVRDSESPVRKSFEGIDFYEPDRSYRVAARLEPYQPPKSIPIANVLGMVDQQPSPGALVFELGGREHRLDPIQEEGSEQLFVMFVDETAGSETYPAGRYLYVDRPGSDGRTTIDFNAAYNPPCVFTPFATCPLPPPQNRLQLAVRAGEKMWKGGDAH